MFGFFYQGITQDDTKQIIKFKNMPIQTTEVFLTKI